MSAHGSQLSGTAAVDLPLICMSNQSRPPLSAPAIARLLAEYGQLTALRGGNPYRAKAYRRAAESLVALAIPIERLVAEDRLTDIPAVGPAIADIIKKLHKTGSHPTLEARRRETPPGLLEISSLPGLRPERVLKLHNMLGVASIEELEQAARADRIKNAKGLGAALQRKILQAIEMRRASAGRRHVHRAAELLEGAERHLREAFPGIERVTAAGDFRRGCELVSDLAMVAEIGGRRPELLESGSDFKVFLTDDQHYGAALLQATGSVEHLKQLRSLAAERGYSLEQDGLWRGSRLVAAETEQAIYRALGLPFIEPELREGIDEIESAGSGHLPALVQDADIRGVLHAHTDRSDGGNTLEEMTNAAMERGYQYFGVTDHSKSAGYAGGLSIEEIEQQHVEIERLNGKYRRRFRVLKGIESDILEDGSLDYPNDILARFDFIVASVHSRFRLDKAAQTQRVIRAVSNPFTTILGHPTGRQLLRRPGYEIDVPEVLRACAKHGVTVEINANPWRLDLDWRWHREALQLGCMMSINPDAHSTSELDLTHWGVELARKGWVPKTRVLNCLSADQLAKHLAARGST
jgi:DNA polymerase (family 10)